MRFFWCSSYSYLLMVNRSLFWNDRFDGPRRRPRAIPVPVPGERIDARNWNARFGIARVSLTGTRPGGYGLTSEAGRCVVEEDVCDDLCVGTATATGIHVHGQHLAPGNAVEGVSFAVTM